MSLIAFIDKKTFEKAMDSLVNKGIIAYKKSTATYDFQNKIGVNVENEIVINKANLRKKGWKNIIHPKSHFIPIIITTISEELSTGSGYFLRRRIEFFDYNVQIMLKLFIGGELTLYFIDSAHYGCMIFFPEDLSDFLKRCIGVLPAKIHDNLSGKNDL